MKMNNKTDFDLDRIVEECSRLSRAVESGTVVPPRLSADLDEWLSSRPRHRSLAPAALSAAAVVVLVLVGVYVARPFAQPSATADYTAFYSNDGAVVADEVCQYALNLLNNMPS